MRQSRTPGEFICTGIYTSAALVIAGCRLLRVQWVDGTDRAAFVFDNADDKVTQTLQQYWDRNLLVDAKAFVDAVYQLKRQARAA